MLQYLIWAVTFVSLWVTIVLLNYIADAPKRARLSHYPLISIGIPAYNEEEGVIKTIKSLLAADYPNSKKEIIVVNDGSTDNTAKVIRQFIKSHHEVKFISKPNGGKASAVNAALKVAKGEFFAVIDADSRIDRNAIKELLPHFENNKTGAVITRIRVDTPQSFLERMQRFEYIMSSLTRFMMRNFGTLAITHGVLSMFRTNVLRKIGGFVQDRNNITEDFEIALRLRRAGFVVEMEPNAIGYTSVPQSVRGVWRQRLRWSRGYIHNMLRYKDLFFSEKQGVFGAFQLPMNVLAVLLLILNVSLISYDFLDRGLNFLRRSFTLPDYFWNTVFDLPSVKELVLAHNIQIGLPVMLSFVLGLYLIFAAHRIFGERLRKEFAPAITYVLVMPYFSTVNWISSIFHEVVKSKRKW